jgi:LDH2 family malate/lactate/ureidoglycolate dehydrogenase
LGQVISQKAMQTAIDKAEKYGLGAVAVRNSTHFGFVVIMQKWQLNKI